VEFLLRLFRLRKLQAHGMQDARRFGELKIGIFDDLDPIAPWIKEIEKVAVDHFRTSLHGEVSDMGSVIDHKPQMPIAIRLLMSTAAERDELIAHIDEGHDRTVRVVLVASPKLEGKYASVETQCPFDITDLQSDMVQADQGFASAIVIQPSRLDTEMP
jgi:predicted RNA-binding protein YlqC (UPF0109 family)